MFNGEVRKDLLMTAMLKRWVRATATLVAGIDSFLVCRPEFLKLPIIHNCQETLEVLLDNLPSVRITAMSSQLLATAIRQLKFDIANLIIDRFPDALRIPVTTLDYYMGAIHAGEHHDHSFARVPPIALWRKMVEGTPDGLLLLQLDGSKETILHIAARLFYLKYVEVLLARFTPAVCSLKNAKGLTATDVAKRRKAGKYRCQLQAQFNADGKDSKNLFT